MKYVRVCDGCGENEYITVYEEHCESVANAQKGGFDFEGCITKQADTIEGLCDEFVVYDIRKKKRLHFIDLKSLLGYCAENGLDKTEIRGAVWTASGLIYAAKMNGKGVLELL